VHIDPGYVEYAARRDLHQRLCVPSLPSFWKRYLSDDREDAALFETICRDIAAMM